MLLSLNQPHIVHACGSAHFPRARFTLKGVSVTTGDAICVGWIGQCRVENGRIAESWTMRQTDFAWDV